MSESAVTLPPTDGGKGAVSPTPNALIRLRRHDERVALALGKREAGLPLTRAERVLLSFEDRNGTPETVAAVVLQVMASARRPSVRLNAAKTVAQLCGDIGSRAEETARAAAMGAAAGAAMGTALALPLAESAQGVLGDIRDALKAARTRTVAPSPEPKPEPPADAAPPA